ncbi:MAG: hypothetical protein ACLGGV_09200 [Bacteroidia bacterium]
MSKIIFKKRRLGNHLRRAFFISFGIFGVTLMFNFPVSNIYAAILSIVLIILGIIYGFGKEMTEISFKENYIDQYIQILFVKIHNKIPLPEYEYVFIKDFQTKVSYGTMRDDMEYYEISLYLTNKRKIILSICASKRGTNKILALLKANNKKLLIEDNTKENVFSK